MVSAQMMGCTFSTSVERTAGTYVNMIGGFGGDVTNLTLNNAWDGVTIGGATNNVSNVWVNGQRNSAVNCRLAGMAYVSGVTSNAGFQVTGTISGTVMTVTSANPLQSIAAGMEVSGTGISGAQKVVSLGTGTGGTGTYNVSASMTVSSTSLTLSNSGYGLWVNGAAGGAGCAISATGNAFLLGGIGIFVSPPNGATVFLFADGNYLDNNAADGLLINGSGAVGWVKVINGEMGTNGAAANGVRIDDTSISSFGDVTIANDEIYSYVNSTGAAIQLIGGTNGPQSFNISDSSIGRSSASPSPPVFPSASPAVLTRSSREIRSSAHLTRGSLATRRMRRAS